MILAQRYYKQKITLPDGSNIGLEQTYEELEKLFDDGYLKIGVSDDMMNFCALIWDEKIGDYIVPDETR